jgi:hypothetical protein
MASYEQVLEYVTTPSTTEPTTLISAFSDSRIVSTFIVSNVGSSSANVSMAIYDGSDNKLVSILSDYSIGIGKSQTLNVNSLNLPATYKVMVESDSEDVNFCASGVKVTATYTGDAEDVIEEYTEAAKSVIDQAVIDAEAQIDAYAEGYEDTITNFASTTLQPYADDAEASATAAAASETNAATSEANASASASSAAASESNASASASSAATSESNAATSATNAATSEANTQALFDNFDSSVAESVGIVAIPYPDLHVPFNDGLRIESGYGTNNQIDVSASQDGSVMVDLPSMSTDFTRSTGSYYINKSGVLNYADVDEPCIDNTGIWLHDSFTVWSQYSNLLTESWLEKVNVEVTDSGETFLGGHPVFDATLTAGSGYRNIRRVATSDYTIGDIVGVTVIAKADTITSFTINIGNGGVISFDLSDGTSSYTSGDFINHGIEHVGDGFYACYFCRQTSETDADQIIRVASLSGSTGDNLKIAMINIGNYTSYMPMQYTTSSSVVVGSTQCSANVNKNLMAKDGFTLVINAKSLLGNNDGYGVVSISDSTVRLSIRYDSSGKIYNNSTPTTGYNTGTVAKYIVVYDSDGNQSLYFNGELVSTDTYGTIADMDTEAAKIYFGSSGATVWRLNNRLKGFYAYNSALTADQVKALGAAS